MKSDPMLDGFEEKDETYQEFEERREPREPYEEREPRREHRRKPRHKRKRNYYRFENIEDRREPPRRREPREPYREPRKMPEKVDIVGSWNKQPAYIKIVACICGIVIGISILSKLVPKWIINAGLITLVLAVIGYGAYTIYTNMKKKRTINVEIKQSAEEDETIKHFKQYERDKQNKEKEVIEHGRSNVA